MSGKPDDVSQEAWDAADGAVHTFCNSHHLWGDLGDERVSDLRTVIAHAITAAKAEESEDCEQRASAAIRSRAALRNHEEGL